MRDLLLGREPKDFDVGTDARPDEVRELFRNCRLIGRRFRLAHVQFGREIIEVATFRGCGSDGNQDEHGQQDPNGRIVRDNVYGTIEEDAWRRDFTVNALYYDIDSFSVLDFMDGMADLESGLIRLIGDPEVRYREDPVRMLRAVRFAAKLGFRIHPETEASLAKVGHLLHDVPPARLFDEVLKLFLGGYAVETFELMRLYGLFGRLFPETERCLRREVNGFPRMLLVRALDNTDVRIGEGKPVTPAFLFAALLWEPLREHSAKLLESGLSRAESQAIAAEEVLRAELARVGLPRRFSLPMREIWALQLRLETTTGKRPLRLLSHPRFRAAYDFLLLRSESGEDVGELAQWWTRIQEMDADQQQAAVRPVPRPNAERKRRRSVTVRPDAKTQAGD